MTVSVNGGMSGLFSVIAFLEGWFLFGLPGAVILAIIVMVVMAIIQFRQIPVSGPFINSLMTNFETFFENSPYVYANPHRKPWMFGLPDKNGVYNNA